MIATTINGHNASIQTDVSSCNTL